MKSVPPPSLLSRTLTTTVVGVALLLSLVFIALSINTRRQVRQNVTTTLESTQRVVAEFEGLRQRQLQAQAAILSESPTLKAAIDTYTREAADGAAGALLTTIQNELAKVAHYVTADVIALADRRGQRLVAVGRLAAEWPETIDATLEIRAAGTGRRDGIAYAGRRVYRAAWVELGLDGTIIGTLYLSTLLDDAYAQELGDTAGTQIAIVDDGRLIAGTLPVDMARDFDRLIAGTQIEGKAVLGAESFAFRRLVSIGAVDFYALGSIDTLSRSETASALRTLALIALGATGLAIIGSIWLARAIARPIKQLSHSIAELSGTHNLRLPLKPTGTSRELDALTDTFNDLMLSVSLAEAATDDAYTGAIRALATALDARDPYTAGHSERVSVLSVAIGETLQLSEDEIEILRLGALLHDIGKIGVPDAVLRKSGPLSETEVLQIRRHPALGARILRSVPFLSAHIPIVELHHERPDGRGYPYGLVADATPLAARIVHVADAYDAMTSARAYRHARSDAAAIAELRRCAGTDFDGRIVEALVRSRRPLIGRESHEPASFPTAVGG